MIAFPSLFSFVQGSAYSNACIQAGEHISDSHSGAGWFLAGPACDAHGATHGLGDQVIARLVGVGAILAEAGDGGVDQLGVDGPALLPAEAQPLHNARPVILNQHISGLHQLGKERFTALVLQIQGHAPLVAVQVLEVHA